MASDLPRFCHRSLSVVLAGALTCSLSWPAHATVVFAPPPDESAPDETAADSSAASSPATPDSNLPAEPAPPDPPTVEEPAPPLSAPTESTVTVGPNTDYETFANSLPDDFDINYVFVPAREPEKDKSTERLSKKQKDRISNAGAAVAVLSIFAGGGMLAPGIAGVIKAKNELSDPLDLEKQQEVIERGKLSNALVIAGGATLGGGLLIGITLLVVGRDKSGSDDASEARVQFAPMLTRSTTGAWVQLRF